MVRRMHKKIQKDYLQFGGSKYGLVGEVNKRPTAPAGDGST
jgi:hypothetical protein